MRKLLLVTAFLSLSTHIFSQNDFRRGFVITQQGDTLYGYVNYSEGSKAHRSCAFKQSKADESTTYKPDELNGYGFDDNKKFESQEITMPDQTTERVFLEVILKGLVSLYKFEAIFLVRKADQPLYSLVSELESTIIDSRRVMRSNNRHIAILNMLLFDCSAVRPRIQKVRLHERPLTDLIQDYNTCAGSAVVIHKSKKAWTKLAVGLTAGANISSLSFEPNGFNNHLTGTFVTSKSPLLGISLDVSSPRLSERFSFQSDAIFTQSKYYNFKEVVGSNTTNRSYTTIELKQLKLPIGFRYTFPERKLRPYINAGLSTTLHLSSASNWILEEESNNVVETFEHEALYIRTNQLGIWGGIGFTKSLHTRLSGFFEVRYEQTQGLSGSLFDAFRGSNSKITNIQLFIGIKTK